MLNKREEIKIFFYQFFDPSEVIFKTVDKIVDGEIVSEC